MSNKLKPCPFCGNLPELVDKCDGEHDGGCFDIFCKTEGCYLELGGDYWFKMEEIPELINLWNKRNA